MTIRAKVMLGLALILAMFIGLSLFVIDRITVMSGHFHALNDRAIPTLGLSAEMSVVLDKLRVTEAYHVLERDRDRMNILLVDIEKLQARMYKLQAEYRELVSDPNQLAAVDALAGDFRTYILTFDALRALSEENRTDDALRQLRRTAAIHSKLLSRIADLDDLTRELADKAGDDGEAAADHARTGAITGVALVAVLMIALMVLTSRTILLPMRRLIGAINLLADGDLASDIPFTGRRDELGDVARALQHFRANAIEKERLQKQERDDLEFARRIQLASVPRRFPAFPERPEIDINGRLAPTRAVGGDFFDFYLTDQRRLVIAIGDASGKGVASAMFVGMARSALKTQSVRSDDPSLCLGDANRTIAADNESMMFMTTFYGVLDLSTGELSYANAGHTPPYLLDQHNRVRPLPLQAGVPLGVVEEFSFAPHGYRLAPGEAIVLYTDGVTEAANTADMLYGEERLQAVLAQHAGQSSDAVVGAVFDSVLEFSRGAPQADDIAILVVRYTGAAPLSATAPARTAAEGFAATG